METFGVPKNDVYCRLYPRYCVFCINYLDWNWGMKEPRIMQMDWKALGYERTYVDGKVRWVSQTFNKSTK